MDITLDWLVNHSQLNNLRCLSSHKNINNIIESVNILDNPDVLKWIKKNELILSTGYFFQDDEQMQISILHELKAIGAAAIGIKIKRFFDTIPERMIEEGEKIGLPIIEIPFYYSFSDISKHIFNEIYTNQISAKQNQIQILDNISSGYFKNFGLNYMVKELSKYLCKTILVTDANFNLLDISLTDEYKYILSNSDFSSIELSDFSPTIQAGANGLYKTFSINDYNFNFYIIMLPNLFGSLCVLLDDNPLSSDDKELINKAINLISLEVSKRDSQYEGSIYRHDFFLDYLSSNVTKSKEEVIELCNFYGFNYKCKRVCISFVLQSSKNEYEKQQILKTLQEFILNTFNNSRNLFICTYQNILCVFLYFSIECTNIDAIIKSNDFVNTLYESHKNYLEYNFKIGISSCHLEIASISRAFKESIDSVNFSNFIDSDSSTISSFNLQLPYHILNKLSKDELKDIYNNNISKLVDFDNEHTTDLLTILQMYYECNFNSSLTSKKLFIHRNTLQNKLDKIKSILDCDFENSQQNIALYLGICAYKLLHFVHNV